MNITKSTDCTIITISDPLLEDFRLSANDVTAAVLHYTDASGIEQTYELVIGDITNDYYNITPSFMEYTTSTFQDGVYCFKLVITQDTSEVIQYGTVLINCQLLCALATVVWNTPEKLMHAKYAAIDYYAQCNNCDCETTKLLFNDFVSTLNGTPINDDCGC